MEKKEILFWLDRKIKNVASYGIIITRAPKYIKMLPVLEKNTRLKEIRKSDKCYIIGLGPSLKFVDFKKLKDGDFITVNSFYKDPNSENIKPILHIMLDWLSYTIEHRDLDQALQSLDGSYFLLNGKYYDNTIDDDKKFWICSWGPEKLKGEIDPTKLCPSFDNVVNFAIYTAMYMGYTKIILLGCDFNSFASRKLTHSYGEEERTLTLSYELFAYSFVADSHMKLAKYAKDHGIQIINATYGSLIDAYNYDEEYAQALLKNAE